MKTTEDSKNRTATGQTNRTGRPSRAAKTHQDYWKAKLKRRSYLGRDGKTVEIPEWQVRMFHLNREGWFNLATANHAAAAVKARDIYLSLVSVGWDATEAKYKPDPIIKADVCTVGEFIAAVVHDSGLKPMTVRRYAVKLRKIVADVAKVEAGMKAKARKMKYDYVNGGRTAWLAKVDGQKLDVLTPDSVNGWRNQYLTKAGTDPVARKSAERSAASYLRCARALFAPDVVSVLKKVKLPANPFAGVKLKDPGPQRYRSDISAELLLISAERELRDKRPQLYLGLFLCLWAGLRRKEADLLLWEQVDFKRGLIHIRRTVYFEPKTEESQRDIDLAPAAIDVLRSFKKGSKTEFVLEGSDPNTNATYDFYRCDRTWCGLHAWLRSKGIRQRKAIHSLRKESGSLIASTFGIEAARQHLGHRDIRTTSAHYADKKKRVEISLPIGQAGQLRAMEGNA
jgi:integrase